MQGGPMGGDWFLLPHWQLLKEKTTKIVISLHSHASCMFSLMQLQRLTHREHTKHKENSTTADYPLDCEEATNERLKLEAFHNTHTHTPQISSS